LTVKLQTLWDENASFYKVRFPDGTFSDAREAIGYIPWTFGLARPEQAVAWQQLCDKDGFCGPCGITTAERRHPRFRSHGTGTCEWDGAVWPFATSQTLTGLAKLLRGPPQGIVTKEDFVDQLLKYSRSHQREGIPYLGEYHDETTGEWLIRGEKEKRSRYYNHSTFADLVIQGLVGIVPCDRGRLTVDPLIPQESWDWFCLERVPFQGRDLTVLWDRSGTRYGRGKGFALIIDGKETLRLNELDTIEIEFGVSY
jgi:hypothetical protein